MTRQNDIVNVATQALDTLATYIDDLSAVANLEAPDSKRPNDVQYLVWYAMATGVLPPTAGFVGPGPAGEVYPPELWESPEGLQVEGSAYELVLPYWDGGKAELDRWRRIVERAVGELA